MAKQARQGDVFVEKVRARGLDAFEPVPTEAGKVILAHGEATGHAHALRMEDAQLFEHPKTKERLFRVVRETDLLHEEHGPIRLEPGTYRVIRQREYAPEGIRNVAD